MTNDFDLSENAGIFIYLAGPITHAKNAKFWRSTAERIIQITGDEQGIPTITFNPAAAFCVSNSLLETQRNNIQDINDRAIRQADLLLVGDFPWRQKSIGTEHEIRLAICKGIAIAIHADSLPVNAKKAKSWLVTKLAAIGIDNIDTSCLHIVHAHQATKATKRSNKVQIIAGRMLGNLIFQGIERIWEQRYGQR